MSVKAIYRFAPLSAQKCRLVADQVRGLRVVRAVDVLKFTEKKAAEVVLKTLFSAIANAENNQGMDIDELFVSRIYVDEAFTIKRFQARAKGRGNRISKRRSHLTIVVDEKKGS